MLVIWTAVHVSAGLIRQLYCLARRLTGRMTARYESILPWSLADGQIAEVWAVVAFPRQLPNLGAAGSRRLVDGDTAPDGTGTPIYPDLSGQYADYLVLSLTFFKRELRGGTAYAHLMRPVALG